MPKDKTELYSALYKLFEETTPLKTDCGVICDMACCKGDDDTGMRLFPGEETSLRVVERNGIRYAVCEGKCDRTQRPLSCRLFPFFPTIAENGRIFAEIDPRGTDVCPLVRNCGNILFSRRFLRKVRKAGELLSKDPDCREFLREITEEIDEANELIKKLGI